MSRAPYEVWLTQAMDVMELRGIDRGAAMDVYDFRSAWDEFGMTPEAAVSDVAVVLENYYDEGYRQA